MITIQEILNNRLLALSWKEPYGTLMLHGKTETRTWETKYRGLVLICLSKLPYKYPIIEQISGKYQYERLIKLLNTDKSMNKHWINGRFVNLYGKAIAIGKLIDCRMKKEDEEKAFVKYYPDLYSWVFEDVTPIEPLPWKGSLGFREVTQEEKKKIMLL
jgi:hypothetical protein